MNSRVLSPTLSNTRSLNASPRPPVHARFDSELLKGYMKKLLESTLTGQKWPDKDKDKVRAWCEYPWALLGGYGRCCHLPRAVADGCAPQRLDVLGSLDRSG